MKRIHNVGKIDRIIRIVLAVIIGTLHFTGVLASQGFLFLAFLLAMTSLNRCCPLYTLLGFGTCGVEVEKSDKTIETKELKLK